MTGSLPTQSIPLTTPQRWRAYWVCVGIAALTILDLTKVNVALPSIEAAFGVGSTELQLIVSGYVLTFGLTLVPAGRIGDQRSRRTMFLIGLTGFLVTSVVCAVAPNVTVLLIGRLLQGVAAGIQMPQVLGLVQQMFQGSERGRAFGLFGATIGIATAFGPTLGGLLIAVGGASDGWRWIFWMNVPLAAAAIVFAAMWLPGPPDRPARKLELDPFGLLLFAVTVVALMFPFLFTTGSPTDDPNRWWTLVVFVFALTGFIAWERRYAATGRHPLVPLALFSISSYRNGTALATAYFTAMPATFLLTTLYLQQGLELEPVYAGMVTIGFALTSAVSSWWGGRVVDRIGRPLVVWGLVVILVGLGASVVLAITTAPEVTPWVMAAALSVAGVGGGLVIAPNQTLALSDVPVRQGGLAGSVGQLGQRIGTAVGTAVALSLFYATIWREGDGASGSLEVYHHAYGYGMIAVALFLAVALALGLADLGARRRQRRALGDEEEAGEASDGR
ncbi:MFS transporter [Agromyces sp. LHK192]|uniref:MFS transporter n=1 Tax=Agromyces sp. LHK192 TaxID=2498704 RepID=UPI000FDCD145|nr:MFS transporter [Agromyces sp. LHK192]